MPLYDRFAPSGTPILMQYLVAAPTLSSVSGCLEYEELTNDPFRLLEPDPNSGVVSIRSNDPLVIGAALMILDGVAAKVRRQAVRGHSPDSDRFDGGDAAVSRPPDGLLVGVRLDSTGRRPCL